MTVVYRQMACAILVLLYLCVPAWAQEPARHINLSDAVALTLANNPELAGLGYRAQALAGERQSTALRPGLELDTSLENVAGTGDFKGTSALELTLSLASVIELGGQREARLSLVSARERQLASAQRQQTLDVLAQLTRQFIQVVANQHYLSLQQDAQSLAGTMLTNVSRQVEAGRQPEVERLRAQALLAQAELDTRAARQALHAERLKLASFWGKTNADFGELRADLFAFPSINPLPHLLEQLANNPDLAVATDETAVRQAVLQQARSQNRPDLNWSAGVRRLQDTGDTALVFGLSVPLGSEGRNRGAIASASAQQAEAQWLETLLRLQLAAQLQADVGAREQSLHEVTQLRERIIPLLTQAADLAQQAFQQGRYSHLELNLARRDLLDARRRLITAAAEAQLHTTAIDRLLGSASYDAPRQTTEQVLP